MEMVRFASEKLTPSLRCWYGIHAHLALLWQMLASIHQESEREAAVICDECLVVEQ